MPDPHDPTNAKTPRLDITITDQAPWIHHFIEVLRETGNVTLAIHASGTTKQAAWTRYKNDPKLRQEWDEVATYGRERAADVLELEAWRRALAGSDHLLSFLLRGLRPGVYGDRVRLETAVTAKVAELAQRYDMSVDEVKAGARKLLTDG